MSEGLLVAIVVVVCLAAMPLASRAVKNSSRRQWPDLAAEADDPPYTADEAEEAELRQLLEAKAYHQRQRGEQPLDVEAELEKLRRQ